jgi:hypothetical protein
MRLHNNHSPWRPAQILGYLGLLAHALLLVPGSALGLIAPLWAILLLAGVWIVLLAVAVRLLRVRPWIVPLVPLLMFGIATAALTLGERLLGWTA